MPASATAVVAATMPALVASSKATRRILVIMSGFLPILGLVLSVGLSELWLAVVNAEAGLRGGSGGSGDAGTGGQQEGDAPDFCDHVGVPFWNGELPGSQSRTPLLAPASADLPKCELGTHPTDMCELRLVL